MIFMPMFAVLAFVGVVCMPLAAAFSWSSAQSRNLSSWRYAVRGAVYSAALLVPWLYLNLRFEGKSVSLAVGTIVYTLLYAGWFFAFILLPIHLAIPELSDRGPGHLVNSGVDRESLRTVIAIAVSANVLLWTTSLYRLIQQYRTDRSGRAPSEEIAPHSTYTRPFRYAALSMSILLPLLLLIVLG